MKQGSKILRGIRLALPLYPAQIHIFAVAGVIIRVARPFLSVLLPRVVLDSIASGVAPNVFFLRVGGLALVLVALNYGEGLIKNVVDHGCGILGIGEVLQLQMNKTMCMDYDLMDDAAFQVMDAKRQQAVASGSGSPAVRIPRILTALLSGAIGFLLYAGAIAAAHPLMLPVLAVTAAVNWLMLVRARRYGEETRVERGNMARRLRTLNEAILLPAAAKDLRLYHAAAWISGRYRKEHGAYTNAEGEVLGKNMQTELVDCVLLLLRDGLAYVLLIGLVLSGQMTPGAFVFAFGAVGGLAAWISGTLKAAAELTGACTGICDIYDALEFPDRMNTGEGAPLPADDALPPAVTLRGLGYTYPKAESAALHALSAEIQPGERIAIVGENGAGKTTLVKLLCGLCLPTEGEVLVAGTPVSAYSRDAYYSMVAVVFQDIHLLAASVAVNIAQTTAYDGARVRECLALVGLDVSPEALLVRAVCPDAIELSGGQRQKLAMARALYKNAPLILLDEPTAALDPIAEREIYEQYAALTAGKTSFYISHRLASTQFCNRILLLDGGVIAECGTHDELMALGGKYAEMFHLQAGYYREEMPI